MGRRSPETAGFTLVELLVVLLLMSVILTFAFGAGRQLWLRRSLVAAEGDVEFALRELQQKAVAESNPLVYGARFRAGRTSFTTYRYNPLSGACAQTGTYDFSAGVKIKDADFDVYRVGGTTTGPEVATLCGPGDPKRYVFFFARGSGTDGQVVLQQPRVSSARERTIEVLGLTGRVETQG